jgi:hypothetical protein
MKYDDAARYVHRLVGPAPDNKLPGLSGLGQIACAIPVNP